jgi:hypothetical protein
MNPSNTTRQGPVDLATQSVAGEEDPGASLDLTMTPASDAAVRPGDESPSGTPGTADTTCPRCHGTGHIEGQPCSDCQATGQITVNLGDA